METAFIRSMQSNNGLATSLAISAIRCGSILMLSGPGVLPASENESRYAVVDMAAEMSCGDWAAVLDPKTQTVQAARVYLCVDNQVRIEGYPSASIFGKMVNYPSAIKQVSDLGADYLEDFDAAMDKFVQAWSVSDEMMDKMTSEDSTELLHMLDRAGKTI